MARRKVAINRRKVRSGKALKLKPVKKAGRPDKIVGIRVNSPDHRRRGEGQIVRGKVDDLSYKVADSNGGDVTLYRLGDGATIFHSLD